MPICRKCKSKFDGVYRQKYCSIKCRLSYYSKVDINTGCINWTAAVNNRGYGLLNIENNLQLAHRIAYKDFHGYLSHDICVLHRCDNPKCINVEHLFLGTQGDNMADMAIKGRAAWKYKKMPSEVRVKIGETLKRNKIPRTKKQTEAASKVMKGKWLDEGFREMMKERMTGKKNPIAGKMPSEMRAKFEDYWNSMKGVKRKPHSEETKQKMREAAIRRYQPRPL